MKDTSFHIKTILFDLIVAIATFFIAEIIAFLASGPFAKDYTEISSLSIYILIPIWTMIFYLIRRQYNFRLTCLQIILTSFTTFTITGLFILVLRSFPNTYISDMWYLVPVFAGVILILTKYATDRFLFMRHYNI